jgi:hypothetical protein
VRTLFVGDASGNHWTLDTTSAAEHSLALHKTIGDVLFLALGRKSHHDFEGIAVGSQYDDLYLTFGDLFEHFVDALAYLLERQ